MPNDFFISYTRRDLAWAEWIAWEIEKTGYKTEIDLWDWHAGDNFIEKMHNAVINNKCIIILLSQAYFASAYTKAEWTAALAQIFAGEDHALITVRIDDFEPSGLLKPYVFIDLHNVNENEAREILIKQIEGERTKPSTPPHFPGQLTKQPRFPGALPPIWNIPHLRNNNFTGREEILTNLDAALQSAHTAAVTQPRAITGLGGIGKTQVALEYVYRHLTLYDVIWWVRGENSQTLSNDYIAFAHAKNLPEKDAREEPVITAAVKEWLGKNRNWLFVYDNVENPEHIRPFLPQGQTGHILITSRHQTWGNLCKAIDITIWPRPESIAFLKTATKETDEAAMNTLAELLGDLPLALEQAAGYINETGSSFTRYISLFQSRHKELWNEESSPLQYKETVATTWSLALERINKESPVGGVILNICAYLSPENITHTLLRETARFLPEETAALLKDDLVFNNGMKALKHFSLVSTQRESISIHRLVQTVVRDTLEEKREYEVWIEAVVKTVNRVFPEDGYSDPGCWPECGELLSHALTVAEAAYKYELAFEETTLLFTSITSYLYGRAQYNEAELFARKSLEFRKNKLDPGHQYLANSMSWLGFVLTAQGKNEEAEPLYRRALKICENRLGKDHPAVATSLNNLAGLLRDQGKYEKAEPLYHRALEICEGRLGKDHPTTIVVQKNYRRLLDEMGEGEN